MMLLLFADDPAQRGSRAWVDLFECGNLFLHMPQNDALDGNRGGGNGTPSKQPGHTAKRPTAQSAKMIASAAAQSPSFQLFGEGRPMGSLMLAEMVKLDHQIRCSPASEKSLGGVDADCAMLAGVIDLHHPVAECLTSLEAGRDCHAPSSHRRRMSAMGRKLPFGNEPGSGEFCEDACAHSGSACL